MMRTPLLLALTLWPVFAGAQAGSPALMAFDLCAGMDGRQGTDCGDRFPAGTEAVYAVLKVRSAPGVVELVWRHAGQVVQQQRLQIKALRASGYRTWARQRLLRGRRGAWTVEVRAADGRTLAERAFAVGAAGADAPEPVEQADETDETNETDEAAAPDDADGVADETADTVEARTGVAVEQDPDDAGAPAADGGAVDGTVDGTADGTVDGIRDGAVDGIVGNAADGTVDGTVDGIPDGTIDGIPDGSADTSPLDAAPVVDARPPDARVVAAAPPPRPARAPTAPSPDEPAGGARRDLGAVWLLMGGVLLLAAGVLLMRQRAARKAALLAPADEVTADPTAEALSALAVAVTSLWTAWWTAADGDPQGCLNRAFRAVPDGTRLALDQIAACNGLEDAASQYAIAPDGAPAEVLRGWLYEQTPALLSVVCALPRELEALGLRGSALPEALSAWGGERGAQARLFEVLDRAAAVIGVERLPLVPYETKATTAKGEHGAELKAFLLPAALVDALGAGSRVVRVDTPPFSPGPTPVVRGFIASGG